MIDAAEHTPRARLHAMLRSFVPVDEVSRQNMLMFVALHTAALIDPVLAQHETRTVPDALHRLVRIRLNEGGLRPGADADLETTIFVRHRAEPRPIGARRHAHPGAGDPHD